MAICYLFFFTTAMKLFLQFKCYIFTSQVVLTLTTETLTTKANPHYWNPQTLTTELTLTTNANPHYKY
jgi:hypothetical protein